MNFWAKALLGVVGVVVSSSVGTLVTYRESIFGGSTSNNKVVTSESDSSDLKDRCYVIPTEENNQSAKLLICKGQDQLNSGENSEYFLYNKDGNKKHKKVKEIKKEESNFEITLESDETQEKVTLAIKKEDWTEISTESNLKDACNLEIYPETSGGAKWKCNGGIGDTEKEIKLKGFQG